MHPVCKLPQTTRPMYKIPGSRLLLVPQALPIPNARQQLGCEPVRCSLLWRPAFWCASQMGLPKQKRHQSTLPNKSNGFSTANQPLPTTHPKTDLHLALSFPVISWMLYWTLCTLTSIQLYLQLMRCQLMRRPSLLLPLCTLTLIQHHPRLTKC